MGRGMLMLRWPGNFMLHCLGPAESGLSKLSMVLGAGEIYIGTGY